MYDLMCIIGEKGSAKMNQQIDIEDMECWIFRMAQKRWQFSPYICAEIFKKYDLLGFIDECYDLLHLNGYERTLDDIEELLKNKGVQL